MVGTPNLNLKYPVLKNVPDMTGLFKDIGDTISKTTDDIIKYKIKPKAGSLKDDPVFENVPDGEYPMKIDGKLDYVRIKNNFIIQLLSRVLFIN